MINVALEEANNEKTSNGSARQTLATELLAVALQPASKVELEQHDMHLPGCHAGGADQLVDIDRAWTKRRYDQLAFVLANIGQGLRRPMLVGGGKRQRGTAEDRRQRLQNVAAPR